MQETGAPWATIANLLAEQYIDAAPTCPITKAGYSIDATTHLVDTTNHGH